jgi:hypothetical protein
MASNPGAIRKLVNTGRHRWAPVRPPTADVAVAESFAVRSDAIAIRDSPSKVRTERRPLHEGSLVLRDELLDVHCVRSGELPDQTIRHLEDAVLEVRHDRLAVAFEMVVIAHAE